jgi:UDP-glucuronate decarboxylase
VTGPINVGNPVEVTIRELAETILRLTGSASPLVFRPLPQDDPMQRCPDITKAREALGWTPRVQLEQGLARTIDYFERLLSGNGTGHGTAGSLPHGLQPSATPLPAEVIAA